MTRRTMTASLFTLFFITSLLPAQEAAVSEAYEIAAVEYRIEGFVLEQALASYLGLATGERLDDLEKLEEYVAAKERLLRNNRIFDLASSIDYELLEGGAEGPRGAKLVVKAKTSWTALALPFLKYSSDDGFSLAVRYKDFNFLGTLEPLSVTLDYYLSEAGLDLGASFNLMPRLLGADWDLSLSGDFTYAGGGFADPDFEAKLGATYPWAAFGLDWYSKPALSYEYDSDEESHTATSSLSTGFGFVALLDWNVSESLAYTYAYDDGTNQSLRNGVSIGTSVELLSLPFFGPLAYSPSMELFLTTALPELESSDSGWTYSHGFRFGRVDWHGNFRRGASFSLSNAYTYHFIAELPSDRYDLSANLDAEAYGSLGNLAGLNARFTGRWFATWTLLGEVSDYEWQDLIRGRRDAIYGDVGLVANLELPLNAAQGRFFGARILEAEVFLDPFLDLALVRQDPKLPLFSAENCIFCGGLEVVIYPALARAFAYRLSVGYDLGDYLATKDFDSSRLEITLGLGTYF